MTMFIFEYGSYIYLLSRLTSYHIGTITPFGI